MSQHRRDPMEDTEITSAGERVRRPSVKRSHDAVEIAMPSTIDDAILYFVSKPAAQRSKSQATNPAPMEPHETEDDPPREPDS